MAGKSGVPFKLRVYSILIHLIVGIFGSTYRICRFEGEARFEKLISGCDPVILSAWHNRIFYFTILIRKRLIQKRVKIAMMSSLSKDGEIGAILGRRIGARVVRGSASRGGTEGFRRFYRLMKKEGYSTIIMPDGSKGPIYEAKMGVAMLAKLTGSPVIPMSYSADRYWRVRSWDKLVIPKPFAKISIAIGDDIEVDRDVDDNGLEACRQKIERSLNELNTRASICFENKG